MPTQTRYFQADVLAAAVARNELGGLFWFVEADYPKRLLPPGIKRRQPATWPLGFIPVLPAGPDVEEQQTWAELLAGLFAAGNVGRGIAFKPTLTTADLLIAAIIALLPAVAGLTWRVLVLQGRMEVLIVAVEVEQAWADKERRDSERELAALRRDYAALLNAHQRATLPVLGGAWRAGLGKPGGGLCR